MNNVLEVRSEKVYLLPLCDAVLFWTVGCGDALHTKYNFSLFLNCLPSFFHFTGVTFSCGAVPTHLCSLQW